MRVVRIGIIAVLFLGLLAATSFAGSIDLNDFYADPTVTVAVDGSSARLAEDQNLLSVLLSNDPGFGDPLISDLQPVTGRSLSFDWEFSEGVGNNDEFGAFLIDASTGLSVGPAFEKFIGDPFADDTGRGSVSWDLSTLTGTTLGIQFQLNAYDFDLGSSVTISNVRTTDPGTTVPLPGAGWAGLALLLGLGATRKMKGKQ